MATPQDSKRVKTFTVEASRCELRIGDLVKPDTPIGWDLRTRRLAKAGCYGMVRSVDFNAAYHALVITIEPET